MADYGIHTIPDVPEPYRLYSVPYIPNMVSTIHYCPLLALLLLRGALRKRLYLSLGSVPGKYASQLAPPTILLYYMAPFLLLF